MTNPMRSSDFLGTLGVNTHIPYTDGGYANIANIAADLNYLGIHSVRDGISTGVNGSAPFSSYVTLAQEGVKFTVLQFAGGSITSASLQSAVSLAAQLNTAVPGSVVAVEGPNEINNAPITYNGVGGLQGAINLQHDLYSLVHTNAALNGVAVDYFTGYNAGGVGVGPNPQTTPGLADFDNQHPYPNFGQAPYLWVNRTQALDNETPATGPAVYTETGYTTNQVSADVQAKYSLDLLMDDAKNGIARTYLYQLMDAYQPGSPQGDDGYGLFDPSNQPKEAATAIHNLTAILADTGSQASTFTPTAFNDTVSGLPATGNSFVLQKSNGATDIVVWNEPEIWNGSSEVAASPSTVNVALGGAYQTVKVFDPLSGSAAQQTLSNVSSVSLSVTDHPLIVEVEPQGTVPPPSDTLTLYMSEDAWKGDAQFTVSMDGKVIGSETTMALHSTGDSSIYVLTGNWGSGSHNVQIQFTNDAYGGTPSTDRNLYVNDIAYDGVSYANTKATMLSDGTRSFTVGGSTPTVSAPADTIVLHLAEDAWQGNALFTLSVDGKQVSTPQQVTALHNQGAWQDFTFAGNLGAGSHTIGVSFTNDAYGGTPSTDRNLYINGISVNGESYGSGVTAMMSSGTTNFTVMTTS
jgi:hypothetical protein